MDKKIYRRSNSASHGCTKTKSVNKKSNNNGSKRNPFTDVTNSLIPTEALLDLCSNSLSPSKAQNLLRRSQTSAFSVSSNFQDSKSDSKSDTSIGSSSFNQFRDAQNPSSVRRPHLSGNEDHELQVYGRRQTSENSEQARRSDYNLNCSGPVKNNMKHVEIVLPVHTKTTPSSKGKNKRPAVARPLDLTQSVKEGANEKDSIVTLVSTPVDKVKDKENVSVGSISFTPAEKSKDKGKSIDVSLVSTSVEKVKDKGNVSVGSISFTPAEKSTDKGKSIDVRLLSTSVEKVKDKGNASVGSRSFTPAEKSKDKGKSIDVPLVSTSYEKGKDKENATVGSNSCTPAEKSRDKRKSVDVPLSPTSEKAMSVGSPSSQFNEQAKDKGNSTTMLINHPITKKIKRNVKAAISSCPPLARSTRNKHNEVDNVKQSRARSEPHPKKAKRMMYSVNEEIEKQKAYFKEIDEFELPVEEVSDIDLD